MLSIKKLLRRSERELHNQSIQLFRHEPSHALFLTKHDSILEGKVAVISGGAADIRDDLGKSVCKNLGPETASFVYCDVSSVSDLDIMVNNAATMEPLKAKILDNDKADFESRTKHAARAMIPSRRGSIINVGSVSSSVGGVAPHAYTSSKHGVHGVVGLTRNVAAELGQYGIHVNCLSPYFILSPLSREYFNVVRNERIGVYSNLDGAAVFLGSDESKYISGHNLAVDGGFTTINPAFGLLARA
ncbi:hypothetical protein EUGRSUZ_C03993 [Eucalyptus grandis]|uniref:Uncharacterized protein n=2 Tax=Eucalyptus grandis TaxID=71139 RepID=A0ACC3LLG2_EUCGR|nr:hypothetical protein EUGRSUZ_C03993 [Eucalyptus grandis]